MLYIDHHCISYFIAFDKSSINPKQLKDPRRELGIFSIFHIWFSSNYKTRILVLIIFSPEKYFIKQNKWEEKIWLLQNNWNTGGKMLKTLFGIYLDFICNFYCIKNIAFFQNIYFVLKNVHPILEFLTRRGKFILSSLDFYLFFYEYFSADRI